MIAVRPGLGVTCLSRRDSYIHNRFDLVVVDHKAVPLTPSEVADNLERVGLQPHPGACDPLPCN